MPGGVA
jgi:hypothetical protein